MANLKRFVAIMALMCVFLAAAAARAAAPVNMNVTNAEVRDVLTALAAVGGVNLVADDSVTGRITISLQNVSFDAALDIVARTKGLTYHKVGSILVVTSREKMNKGFGSIEIIKLNYAKAADVKKSLALVLPEDRLKVDEASNSLVFMGSTAEIAEVRRVLQELDIPFRQISLEAQVVAIDKKSSKDLGIDWQWSSIPNSVNQSSTSADTASSEAQYGGVITFGKGPDGPYEFRFAAKLSALLSSGNAKILAKPNITALDGQQARILIGDRIPVLVEKTENGKTTTTIEYVEAGIKLMFTPRINADGLITTDIQTEVSTPTLVPEMKAYRITTREAETRVRMKDGETMVIGGLIGTQESGGKNKVPFLADLPVFGKLFQSVHTTKQETEVMIFVTARIVK
ncbi:MAG: type II and III secretion system protein [Negativicutes bacterium]|nr:type II and III secretion system protein [Negativicutes bacterium]